MERKRTEKNLVIGLALMALVAWNLMVSPGVCPAASRNFRMTGYLLPEEKTDTSGAYILHHEGQRWVFRVTRAETTSHQIYGASGYAILKRTGREELRLLGSKEAIRQLKDPDLTCMEITLHGTLYPSNNVLSLFQIDETPEGEQVESCM